jgi:hypothetical protein
MYKASAFRYDTVAQPYGPMAGQMSPALAGFTQRLIVLDPAVDGTYRFPLIAEEDYHSRLGHHHRIGRHPNRAGGQAFRAHMA